MGIFKLNHIDNLRLSWVYYYSLIVAYFHSLANLVDFHNRLPNIRCMSPLHHRYFLVSQKSFLDMRWLLIFGSLEWCKLFIHIVPKFCIEVFFAKFARPYDDPGILRAFNADLFAGISWMRLEFYILLYERIRFWCGQLRWVLFERFSLLGFRRLYSQIAIEVRLLNFRRLLDDDGGSGGWNLCSLRDYSYCFIRGFTTFDNIMRTKFVLGNFQSMQVFPPLCFFSLGLESLLLHEMLSILVTHRLDRALHDQISPCTLAMLRFLLTKRLPSKYFAIVQVVGYLVVFYDLLDNLRRITFHDLLLQIFGLFLGGNSEICLWWLMDRRIFTLYGIETLHESRSDIIQELLLFLNISLSWLFEIEC